MSESAVSTIRREQYHALLGLLTLARQHTQALDDIERAMVAITAEEGDVGGTHTADSVYGRETAPRQEIDRLLARLEITVEDE